MELSDFSPYAVNLETRCRWVYGREIIDYNKASTHFVFGIRFAGKSSLLEAIASNYIINGATIFDLYCADDSESLAWLDSPYKKILLVCGNSMRIKSKWPYVQVKDLDLEITKKYQIVLTCPEFFGNRNEMYISLMHIVTMLRKRTVFPARNSINFLLVREASELISSQMKASRSKINQAEAQEEILNLVKQAFHANLAIGIDSLRPQTININMRKIANYAYLKTMGRLDIDKEYSWAMERIRPEVFRRMPPSDYILYTDKGNVAQKSFDEPPWHNRRGYDIIGKHNIVIEHIAKGEKIKEEHKDNRRKVDAVIHRKIIELKNKGHSNKKIGSVLLAKELNMKGFTLGRELVGDELANHQRGVCGFCD